MLIVSVKPTIHRGTSHGLTPHKAFRRRHIFNAFSHLILYYLLTNNSIFLRTHLTLQSIIYLLCVIPAGTRWICLFAQRTVVGAADHTQSPSIQAPPAAEQIDEEDSCTHSFGSSMHSPINQSVTVGDGLEKPRRSNELIVLVFYIVERHQNQTRGGRRRR